MAPKATKSTAAPKPRSDDGDGPRRGKAAAQAARTGVGILTGSSGPRAPADGSPIRRADEVAALLLKLVTMLALTFGLFEYDRQQHDGRISQSLGLVQEWETGGYQDAYTRINDMLWPLYSESAGAIAAVGDDAEARALLYGNIGEVVTGRDDSFVSTADRDVDKVFHFFERAAICSDETICDYGVLKTFFGSESQSFWLYFAKYAERRRADGFAFYGQWTRRFVDGDIRRPRLFGII